MAWRIQERRLRLGDAASGWIWMLDADGLPGVGDAGLLVYLTITFVRKSPVSTT